MHKCIIKLLQINISGDIMRKKFLTLGLSASLVLFLGATNFAMADGNESTEEDSSSTEISGWINTRIPYDISAKELAQRYYNDENDYMIIVNANKGLFNSNLILRKNTEVKIPITPKFTDQPEILGWN